MLQVVAFSSLSNPIYISVTKKPTSAFGLVEQMRFLAHNHCQRPRGSARSVCPGLRLDPEWRHQLPEPGLNQEALVVQILTLTLSFSSMWQ